jgi:nucleotide-binding universal stress UspA family protein
MSIPYKKILVPLDGSELAVQALPHAEAIARGSGAELILVQIVETTAGLVMAPAGMASSGPSAGVGVGRVGIGVMVGNDEKHRRAMDEAEAYLERLAASLKHRKNDVEVDINIGDPAIYIVDYAATQAVDLIVMSTHGRTGLGRWAYGSVTNKVLQAAPCAVLVVRPTAG